MAVIGLPITEQSQDIVCITTKLAIETLLQKVDIALSGLVRNFFCYERSEQSTNVELTLLEIRMDLLGHMSFRLRDLVVYLWRNCL